MPLLAANLVKDAIAQDENTLILLDDNGTHTLPRASKLILAQQLILHAAKLHSSFYFSTKIQEI